MNKHQKPIRSRYDEVIDIQEPNKEELRKEYKRFFQSINPLTAWWLKRMLDS